MGATEKPIQRKKKKSPSTPTDDDDEKTGGQAVGVKSKAVGVKSKDTKGNYTENAPSKVQTRHYKQSKSSSGSLMSPVERGGGEASPFTYTKSTPRSAMSRLSKLEKATVKQMRRVSIEGKERNRRIQQQKHIQLTEDLQILDKGSVMLKVPHRGKPKKTKFYIRKVDGEWRLSWDSKNKSKDETTFPLKEALCALGQGQGLFKEKPNISKGKTKQQDSGHSRLSLTLMFQERTIDVMAENPEDFNRWCRVLKHVGVVLETQSGYT